MYFVERLESAIFLLGARGWAPERGPLGISDTPAWIVAQANTLANVHGWSPFVALQIAKLDEATKIELGFPHDFTRQNLFGGTQTAIDNHHA
jgi:hypothetical protein